MKCELCGNEIVKEYRSFINADSIVEISICGRCSLLIEINDNLKKLLDKPIPPLQKTIGQGVVLQDGYSPVVQ